MDGGTGDVEYHTLRIPAGTDLDGAVVELQASPDLTIINAEIRIPAHQPGTLLNAHQDRHPGLETGLITDDGWEGM